MRSCALVKSADVFVTNYQSQLLKKFRISWDDLRPLNDRLIYAHLTGYGDAGDDADEPAFDALAYWARSGLFMSMTGRDGTPAGPRPGLGDHPTAMSLFGAIMLGLYQREKTGRGGKVGTSLMASAHGPMRAIFRRDSVTRFPRRWSWWRAAQSARGRIHEPRRQGVPAHPARSRS